MYYLFSNCSTVESIIRWVLPVLVVLAGFRSAAATSILDTNFNAGTGPNGPIYACAIQDYPSKIVVGGNFTTFSGESESYIARMSSSGSLDDDFLFPTTINGVVYALAAQRINSVDKIIVGGAFTTVNGVSQAYLARLDYNGTLDTNFANLNLNGAVRSIALASDGKIYIAGDFTSVGGSTRMRVARLLYSGVLDTNFDPYYGANSTVYSVGPDSDGGVYVGGAFTTFGGSSRSYLARLLSSGSVDTLNRPANNIVRAVLASCAGGDPRCYVGGDFTTIDSTTRNRLGQVTRSGSLGTAFGAGDGANGSVYALATGSCSADPIVGGSFTEVNGVTRNGVARIGGLTGTLDSWNDAGGIGGSGATVHTIAIQSDGKIVVGGVFETFENVSRKNIARLNP